VLPDRHPVLFEVADDGEFLGMILPARHRPQAQSMPRLRGTRMCTRRRVLRRVAHGSSDPPDDHDGRQRFSSERESHLRVALFMPGRGAA
jgi:hypothetical protein